MSASLNNGNHSFEPHAQASAMGYAAGTLMRRAARATAAALLLAGLAACSTTPDWAKPNFIYGDDLSKSSGAGTEFPALADVPEKPTVSTTESERAELAESLAADRVRARYTDEVLRGGAQTPAIPSVIPTSAPMTAPMTVPARLDEQSQIVPSARMAAAQAAEAVQPTLAELRAASTVSADFDAKIADTKQVVAQVAPVAAAQVQSARAQPSAIAQPMSAVDKMLSYRGGRSAAAQSRTITSDAAGLPVLVSDAATSASDRLMAASQTEAQPVLETVAAAKVAVPAVPSGRMAKAMAYEAEDGVDARISAVSPVVSTQAVSERVAQASVVPARVTPSAVVTSATFQSSQAPALTRESLAMAGNVASTRYQQTHQTVYVGGSDSDNGAVTINMDALNHPSSTATRKAVAAPVGAVSVYDGQGGPGNIPPYVLQFDYGSAALTAADRAALSEVLPAVGVYGDTVRIVGHASQLSGQEDDSKAKWANFSLSMQRAEAVAMELANQGVAAKRIIVEAAGDSVPVYYQSAMPAGEPGDRRVEIFIE